MVTYPIHIRRDTYSGKVQYKIRLRDKTNVVADILETYINDLLSRQVGEIDRYMSYAIISATGVDPIIGRSLITSIDSGSNGFTAYRHDLSPAEVRAILSVKTP